MQRLFLFLYKYRAFLLFAFLECVSVFFLTKYNTYQQAVVLNSSNTVVGGLLNTRNNVSNYFSLKDQNLVLLEENRQLREKIKNLTTLHNFRSDTLLNADSTRQYVYKKAEVVNSTVNLNTNYITVKGGKKEGFKKGDALVSEKGVVGKLTHISANYSTAVSLLHVNNHVSAVIKRTKTICSAKWNGQDAGKTSLLYVPRHVEVLRGDSVVTSGYNAVFPTDILIGIIDEVTLSPDASFYEIAIDLAVDFNNLNYVYCVHNIHQPEQDSIERITLSDIEN